MPSQKEVIPVDTHVHQIAIKHYGLRTVGGSKRKGVMTPRIYDEVATKLADIWGEYAGWAHSVGIYSKLPFFF
jgi:N-glycosylase/DNA lyase